MDSISDGQAAPGGRNARLTIGQLTQRALGVARNGDFARFWAGQAVSNVGSQFTLVALPLLAALSLGASPMALGVLGAASGFPHLVFGLFAGAWVDRLRRRPVMIATDLARAALLAMIPLAAWYGVLRVELLFAIAFLAESCTVFFDIAYLAYVPALVPKGELVAANSRLEATASGAQVIGPALGGTFVRLLGAPLAMLVDAASYLVSAAFLSRIRTPEPAPARPHDANLLREIGDGLRGIWRSRILRALALATGLVNFGGYLFLSIYVLYLTRVLGLDAAAVGLVFAAGGVGALLGSIAAGLARARWGTGPVLIGSLILFGVFGMTVPVAVLFPRYALPLVVAAELLQWLALLVYNINAVSLRQAITPAHLLGRVNGSIRFIMLSFRPAGSLLGGILGMQIGLPATLAVGAFGMLIAFVPMLASPIPGMDEPQLP